MLLNFWTKRLDIEYSIEALEHSESAKQAEIDYNILLIVTNEFRQMTQWQGYRDTADSSF